MKYLLIVTLLLLVYLNRSYAHFFDFVGSHYSNPPVTPQGYLIPSKAQNLPLKYFALGDSLTIGVGSSDLHFTYPFLVGEKLEMDKGAIALTNLGIPGETTRGLIKDELPQTIKAQPDYVTLMIGINDIHNDSSLADFQKNYDLIVDDLKSHTKAKITLINIPYLGSNMVLYPPYNILLDLRTRQFNRIIAQIANQNHLSLIDLYAGIKSKFSSNSLLYSRDNFHPSDSGYAIWGQIINAD